VETSGGFHRVGISGTQVALNGKPYDVDVARTGNHWSLLVGGRSYEVAIDQKRDGLIVHVNGHAIAVAVRGSGIGDPGSARRIPNAGSRIPNPESRIPSRIVAPMPGRILKVLVKVGDSVKPRQGLVVVEAMKMENELRAPSAGTVTEIRAVEGTLVEAHAVLVVLE
jgi:biotin carboxyl carrier protein